MEFVRFIFWTAMKTLGLAFLSLLAVKAVSSLRVEGPGSQARRFAAVRSVLYAVIVALAALGARSLGYDVAAEIYARTASSRLATRQIPQAYNNALRAVEIRPGVLRHWQILSAVKFAQRQYDSMTEDYPAVQALSGGKLEEEDTYRLAAAYYFQGHYDKVFPLTRQLINENRIYAAPYVLQGYTYTAQRRFAEAERSFLEVLQMFPTQQMAVEGLAHVRFLAGNTAGALKTLDETAKFPFPPEARARLEALKALYAQ